jgi:hypothetical protein
MKLALLSDKCVTAAIDPAIMRACFTRLKSSPDVKTLSGASVTGPAGVLHRPSNRSRYPHRLPSRKPLGCNSVDCVGGISPMSRANEIGFEGHLPPSIKPGGFSCHRRGGCDRDALCAGEGECLGVNPGLANPGLANPGLANPGLANPGLANPGLANPGLANTLNRNRFNELAVLVRALTYAEMLEFSRGLWKLRGEGKLNSETLPRVLHAWATASDRAILYEPAPPAGARDFGAGKDFRPIDTAPKDQPILAFMLGRWRIARWKPDHRKRLAPFWSADDLRVAESREHQPEWWVELPPSPPEAAG